MIYGLYSRTIYKLQNIIQHYLPYAWNTHTHTKVGRTIHYFARLTPGSPLYGRRFWNGSFHLGPSPLNGLLSKHQIGALILTCYFVPYRVKCRYNAVKYCKISHEQLQEIGQKNHAVRCWIHKRHLLWIFVKQLTASERHRTVYRDLYMLIHNYDYICNWRYICGDEIFGPMTPRTSDLSDQWPFGTNSP